LETSPVSPVPYAQQQAAPFLPINTALNTSTIVEEETKERGSFFEREIEREWVFSFWKLRGKKKREGRSFFFERKTIER
jgi:hypothetical protein